MPVVDPTKIIAFENAIELSKWLEKNHAIENELWIKIYKKHAKVVSVTWDDVVIESLCWGWIDGIKKSMDEHAYLQRITPRTAKSLWSKRNRCHVECLEREGRMQGPGLAQVHAAKADGRWQNAYAVSEMTVPEDFISALENNLNAKEFYQTLPKSSRCIIANGLLSAKKADTRQRRFQQYLLQLSRHQKPR